MKNIKIMDKMMKNYKLLMNQNKKFKKNNKTQFKNIMMRRMKIN